MRAERASGWWGWLGTVVVMVAASAALRGQVPPDRCLVPPVIRDAILNEYSGELAYQHVQILAANRDRQAEEYQGTYFEATYLSSLAKQYGLSDAQIEYFPAPDAWDAEEADLWLVSPVRKKIASLNQVPAALANGSSSADVEAEVVYVGAGRDEDYRGKDVTGRIVLADAAVGRAFSAAVVQRGAAGVLGTGSAGVSADSPGYTLDQIGWASVSPRGGKEGFGFALSLRQMLELQSYFERGTKVVMRAHVRTKKYPQRMNVVSAAIPGTDPTAGDLLIVAHAFETISTPGAADNCTGVGTTLEIARTLARLVRDGALPQPKRTIRFLWVPEISGSRAWMFKHPEMEDRLIAAMNFDMPGEDLERTDTYLRMKMTPDSVPSYLNDLIANLLLFVDQTEIRTQTGNNAPFNYRMVPFISASDHMVFLAAGIPAMQFNHWPDNFYHSSADTIVQTDPTEMKRSGFMGAAAFYYLATAGPAEARALAWESAANGSKWITEVGRQSVRLLGANAAELPAGHTAAQNKVRWAFNRAKGGVQSVTTVADDPSVRSTVDMLVAGLDGTRAIESRNLEAAYKAAAGALGVQPVTPAPTPREVELASLVPKKRFKTFSEEARVQAERTQADRQGPPEARRPGTLSGLAASEVQGFIDGKRSILDIWNAVRAEYGNVTTSTADYKFAYVVTPAVPDIELEAVAAAIQALEQAGTVEIAKVPPAPPRRK